MYNWLRKFCSQVEPRFLVKKNLTYLGKDLDKMLHGFVTKSRTPGSSGMEGKDLTETRTQEGSRMEGRDLTESRTQRGSGMEGRDCFFFLES